MAIHPVTQCVTQWRTTAGGTFYDTPEEASAADAGETLAANLRLSTIFWGTCDPVEVADWLVKTYPETFLGERSK